MFTVPIGSLIQGMERVAATFLPPSASVVRIHVDEIAAKIAKFYERIRNVVDYREEHLFRKHCILRGIQRRLLFGATDTGAALDLIKEIIRSGHLPNDTIPEERSQDVEHILTTLSILIQYVNEHFIPEAEQLKEWLIRLSSCAVEECLVPPVKDSVISTLMLDTFLQQLVIKGEAVTQSDRRVQIFISVQRALLKVDEDQLSYRLLQFLYPYWDHPTTEQLESIARSLPQIMHSIELFLADPLHVPFYKLANHHNTVFLLLGDALFSSPSIREEPGMLLKDRALLHPAVLEAYKKRYRHLKISLRRLAFFSIISLFITKVLIALAIEVPLDRYVTHNFSFVNTIINIVFPPVLLLCIILFIRMPTRKNVDLVMRSVDRIVYDDDKKEILLVIPKERNMAIKNIVQVIYILLSTLILGAVATALQRIGFSSPSIVVFILFTSIVAATGVKVHNRSREISLELVQPTILGFLRDLFVIPFVTLGTMTISGLEHFKFLVMLVNLIDVPFLEFITFVEHFNTFLRYKKDELH